MSLKFKINQPPVVAEQFDAEVIAIQLETGRYYSMEKSAVTIWALLTIGATLSDILAEVNARYEGEPGLIAETVQQFIDALQKAQLIVPYTNGHHADFSPLLPFSKKIRFEPPLLSEYSDMQDLLLLDPILEVDGQGWPQKKVSN